MDDGPTDAHYDFAAKVCGFDPRTSSQPDDEAASSDTSPDPNAATTPDGAGYSAAPAETFSTQPSRPADATGGMSAGTSDGAGYSAAGTAPDSSQPQSDDGGGGGTSAATSDGAGYSAAGTGPDSSQAPAPEPESGGMSGTTPDGSGYSTPGTVPDSSQAPPPSSDSGGGMSGSTPDGAGYSAPGTAPDSSQPTEPAADNSSDERSLTSAEIAYARDIFQDTLDYSVITLTRDAIASTGADRTLGNTINMELDEFVPGTFDLTPSGKETLIHEMTHVWQYQHEGWTYAPAALWAQLKAWVTDGDRGGAYDWRKPDSDGVPWDDWNPEAQASAVERYNQALRATKSGKGGKSDFDDLSKLQKYIDQMLHGPTAASGSGSSDPPSDPSASGSAGGDGNPVDAGTPGGSTAPGSASSS